MAIIHNHLTSSLYNNCSLQWSYGVTCWEIHTGSLVPYAAT